MPGPQVCVGGCLRVFTRGMAVGARFRGASGTPPPAVCPGMGGDGSLPLIRPCGATFPQGGKARAVVEGFIPPGVSAAAGGRGGVGAPRPTDGDMETLWDLRGHPFPGRRAVGAGHARPGGWREHPFPFYRLTPPTSPPTYSRCCRRQNRWGRSAHRPHARFRRWIRSRGASGHRRSGPEGTGVCRRRNFSSAG